MSQVISRQAIAGLVDSLLAGGTPVVGPCRIKPGLILYQPLRGSAQLVLDGFVRPANSIKEFFLPRHEPLYRYQLQGKRIELVDIEPPAGPQVILGARPCDAGALPVLDQVFGWQDQDTFFQRRRDLTTIVTLACPGHDEHCCCTSVDLGPAHERGSDAMLLELDESRYEVRTFSAKGEQLFAGRTEPSHEVAQVPAGPPQRFDLDTVGRFLDEHYDSSDWQTMTLRCLGCGTCAYTCPTCHCFDIIDEPSGRGGARVRNWDTCQSAVYSRHASGHNPRHVQGQRQRNRIYHKYRTYPEKFGAILCTGCGNCSRRCPVGLGVRPLLQDVQERAAAAEEVRP